MNPLQMILLAVSASNSADHIFSTNKQQPNAPSKWARRTARKRQRTEELLNKIDISTSEEVKLLNAPTINWTEYPDLDPQKGGKLRKNTARATRKQHAVEAFVYVCQTLLGEQKSVIFDAGSGAGNLAIPLAGLIPNSQVIAIDVNEIALQRLQKRYPSVETLCADLASGIDLSQYYQQSTLDDSSTTCAIVTSLHACGAATDMGMELATRHRLPFCMSPCCTAKAMVERKQFSSSATRYGPTASCQRSGAPNEITYPRSSWLQQQLGEQDTAQQHDYMTLAKVADVGLGPQTPDEQRTHQFRAKQIVEWDRLYGVVERHDYAVAMFEITGHENYGKREILVGVPSEADKLRQALDRL